MIFYKKLMGLLSILCTLLVSVPALAEPTLGLLVPYANEVVRLNNHLEIGDTTRDTAVTALQEIITVPAGVTVKLHINFVIDAGVKNGANLSAKLWVDGVLYEDNASSSSPGPKLYSSLASGFVRATPSMNYVIDLDPGAHTIEMRVHSNNIGATADAILYKGHSHMQYTLYAQQ